MQLSKNINEQHKDSLSFHERLAVKIVKLVGTMYCAYLFAIIALISLPEAVHLGIYTTIAWIAQTFLQLVLLSIIMVGQNLQNRHAEMRSDNDYMVNVKAEQEIEDIQLDLELIKKALNISTTYPQNVDNYASSNTQRA